MTKITRRIQRENDGMNFSLASYRTVRLTLTAFVFSIAVSGVVARAGEVVTHRLDSDRLAGNLMGERTTNLITQVYLPDGYRDTDERYPVLYWFGGWGLGSTHPMGEITASSIDKAIENGTIPPTIIVSMPVDAPTFDHSLYLSSEVFGDWEGFATSEVIPFIDATYRTMPTPEKRGIAGFSSGGFTALMLPVLHPNTWGAIGAIDPSSWTIGSAVRNPENWPDKNVINPAEVRRAFARMPDTLEGFRGTGPVQIESQWYGQVAARFSPSPDSAVPADFPIDRQGEWVPDVREAWRQFDLGDPAIASQHRDVLHDIATISIVIPESETRSVALWNRELVETFQQVGVNAVGVNWPGDHGRDLNGRFIAMVEDMTVALMANDVGDINRNGKVEPNDLRMLMHNIDLGTSHNRFDVNADASVNLADAQMLAQLIGTPNAELLTTDHTYTQDFNSLGISTQKAAKFPHGWLVTDKNGLLRLSSTNLAFPVNETETLGVDEPFALNTGTSSDGSLATYKPLRGEQSAIQFMADTSTQSNALQFGFTVEAWDRIRRSDQNQKKSEASFEVVVDIATNDTDDPMEFVLGGEFRELARLPNVTMHSTSSQSINQLDSKQAAFRTIFDSGILPAEIPADSRLRFRWVTTGDQIASEGWIFGIDDVDISLLFLGDFDSSGELDINDLEALGAAIVSGSQELSWDLNGDRTLDVRDLQFWVSRLHSTAIGDSNLNGEFESGDFIAVFQSGKYENGEFASWSQGDWNADGVFDSSDLVAALQAGGYEDLGPMPTIHEVPEPYSSSIAFLALLILMRLSKKERTRHRKSFYENSSKVIA